MVPFQISIERLPDTLIFEVRGIVTGKGIADSLHEELSREPVNNIIWDLSHASLSSLQPDELASIAACAKQFEPHRPNPRTAIIVSTNVDAVLMRLYEAVAEKVDLQTRFRIVETRAEAMHWLAKTGN